jgi:very-short-patch-repair endonuclease
MNDTFKLRARKLRKNSTDAEHRLWSLLRDRRLYRYKFRRQHIIGTFIVDFVCLRKKIIIELDGGQHAGNTNYDSLRTKVLESQGFKVIRFWNESIFKEKESVITMIITALDNATTS